MQLRIDDLLYFNGWLDARESANARLAAIYRARFRPEFVPAFRAWMTQIRDLGLDRLCFILAGVGPIISLPALERLKHLPGLWVPEEVERRLRGVPEDCVEAEGFKLCSEIIEAVREIPGVAGVHLIAANLEEQVPQILGPAGIQGRRDEPVAATSGRDSGRREGH